MRRRAATSKLLQRESETKQACFIDASPQKKKHFVFSPKGTPIRGNYLLQQEKVPPLAVLRERNALIRQRLQQL